MMTIRYPQNPPCDCYLSDVQVYGQRFRSSDHAFQWKFAKHVRRYDLAQEISQSATAEKAKTIASRVPSHLSGSWHKGKMDFMEEILDSTAKSYPEFRQALINSAGMRLVEAVKSDIFLAVVLTHMMLPLPKLYTTQDRTN